MTMPDTVEAHSSVDDSLASYLHDVLVLPDHEVENDLDGRLKMEAKELGLDADGYMQTLRPTAITKPYTSDVARTSQESLFSRASHSTGLTSSNFSDLSRDQPPTIGGPRSRASLSIRDYDAFLARGTRRGRNSLSFSPPTTPSHSSFSLPLSSPDASPKKHFRRLRGLSMLKLYRNSSSSSLMDRCPHCAHDPVNQRRAMHKLPCGHKLCTQALRNTISTATQGETGQVPSCCGQPIPGRLVEHVMTQTEQDAFLDRLEHWDSMASHPPSLRSVERRDSVTTTTTTSTTPPPLHPPPLAQTTRSPSSDSKPDSLLPKMGKDLEKITDLPAFRVLRDTQFALRERFTTWTAQQHHILTLANAQTRTALQASHTTAIADLEDAHILAIAAAEDAQVTAEANMRSAHLQAQRDHAVALRHMEAYCAGTYSTTGEPHHRAVTDQDRVELEKRRAAGPVLEVRQRNAINVLRGDQSRRLRNREQRQAKEIVDLCAQQRLEVGELDAKAKVALQELEGRIEAKRMRIRGRWQLQIALFVKRLEGESVEATAGGGSASAGGCVVPKRLPLFEWQGKGGLEGVKMEDAGAGAGGTLDGGLGWERGVAVSGAA